MAFLVCWARLYSHFSIYKLYPSILAEQFDTGLQYRSMNTSRSAISMTHTNVDGIAVGRHPLVSRLLRGMFNFCPPSPHYTHSWDVWVVANFLSSYNSADLTTLQWAKKAVTLLTLINADRCSNLAALDREHVQWTARGVQFTVVHLTKTRRSGPPRKVFYATFAENSELCPVTVLRMHIDRTAELLFFFSAQRVSAPPSWLQY